MTEQGQQIDDWGSTDVDLERVHDFEIEAMDVRLQTMGPLADWPLGPENAGVNARKRTREENTKTCLQCDRSNLVPKVDGWDSKHGFQRSLSRGEGASIPVSQYLSRVRSRQYRRLR